MKSSIHPTNYRLVVFSDEVAGFSFLTRSTAPTKDTVKWEDGNEYPMAKVEISSSSHPFFTGTMTIIDTAGRVERFEKRYGRRKKAKGAEAEAPAAEAPAAEAPAAEAPAAEEAAPEAAPEEASAE